MQKQETIEYMTWVVKDTVQQLILTVAIYAVALGAYWTFVK